MSMATVTAPRARPIELNIPSLNLRLLNSQRLNYASMSDIDLVSACKQHDSEAFKWLVKRYEKTVYSILYKLTPEQQDPRDLVQDVWLRLWSCIHTLANPHAFRGWLKRIVTNLLYDQLRRRPKQVVLSLDDPIDNFDGDECASRQIADPSALPDELAERCQLSATIQAAVAKLSPQSKTMIELRDIQGLSYNEIAEMTKSPIGTVKSRIARARAKLQAMLSPYVDELPDKH